MNYYNYFTEIEEHFVRRRGKHLLVSPMDWHLMASWREAGVPLHVALRGIDIALDNYRARNGAGRVNSLCYCHEAVMEAFVNHTASHVGEAPPEYAVAGASPAAAETETAAPEADAGEEFGKTAILEFLLEKIREISEIKAPGGRLYKRGAPENIERVLARLRELAEAVQTLGAGGKPDTEALERDLRILDGLLVEGLRAGVTEEEAAAWEQEAKKDKILKVYKKQLPRESYEKMLENFYRDKARQHFRVGELSLFRL